MKTFETEKHNIPEGATHYSDECVCFKFIWAKLINGSYYTLDECNFWSYASDQFIGAVGDFKPIPQTKEVEWENGDACLSNYGYEFTFIGKCNQGGFDCILLSEKGVPTLGFIKELSKPETPEAKKEREELEAAYDLYCHVANMTSRGVYSFEQFCDESLTDYKADYLAIARKTGYRVEK